MLLTRSFGALRARDMLYKFVTERDRHESLADERFTDKNTTRDETQESVA